MPQQINQDESLEKMLLEAIKSHGEESDVANFLRQQISDAKSGTRKAVDKSPSKDSADSKPGALPSTIEGIAEKGMVVYIALGFVIVFAFLGFSTLFIGMLAAKWLAL